MREALRPAAISASLTSAVGCAARFMDDLSRKIEEAEARMEAEKLAWESTAEERAQEEAQEAARRHVERMEEIHNRCNPGKPFARQVCYDQALAKINAAFKEQLEAERRRPTN